MARLLFALPLSLFVAAGCGGGQSPALRDLAERSASAPSHEVDANTAKRRAEATIAGGVALNAVKEDEEQDEHRWLIDVKLETGEVVRVEADRVSGNVLEITSRGGPYQYDFALAGGLQRFGQARDRALAAKSGSIHEWEVDLETSEYEFQIDGRDGTRYKVTLDARSGATKAVKAKTTK